ncbi:amino acid ABC transporter substrate-binding protein [Marinobacterium nitratireducens]|uniref:Amino acid ABC transporter substrate-binding protein n=1 Tax=Marinobacterium nitratireducens TaxID=518897 RepID=A0A917ZA76_9GAMM|nr:amino acid ABC transporter substrate-binding protein [Marinobacterium nitratireducens]GGO79450.1 amino acid ABC transporter substrate-binding protein [Marinobacterium nitratireducens]
MMKKTLAAAILATTTLSGTAMAEGTLEAVKGRDMLQCGVTNGVPGFSVPDEQGNWHGLDVDVCKAVAAAVLGDATKVKYIPLTAKERFTALQSGEIDVLSRVTTWTQTRDTQLGLNFTGVTYYDGQGFLVKKDLGLKSVKELDGATVCVQSGTTTELNLADYFRANGLSFTPVVFDTNEQAASSFDTGRCDAFTTDLSQAYGLRTRMSDPDAVVALPEVISKEPLGPVVRQGDDQWFNVVKWSLFAMLNAEELGVTSANVDEMKGSENPNIKRLLGIDGPKGKGLDIADDWSYQVIKQVGNYGEAFERNVGMGSALKIERGINALWNQGGFQYAPPMR